MFVLCDCPGESSLQKDLSVTECFDYLSGSSSDSSEESLSDDDISTAMYCTSLYWRCITLGKPLKRPCQHPPPPPNTKNPVFANDSLK